MKKFKCLISHVVPGAEPGRFAVYEAGAEYDMEDAPEALFRAVYGSSEADVEQGALDGAIHRRRK